MTSAMEIVDWVNSAEVQQQVYQAVLRALSYPGSVQSLFALHTSALNTTALSLVLATLVDEGAKWADEEGLVPAEMVPLLGAPSRVDVADFVVCNARCAPTADFKPRLGTLNHPHLGATLIWQCEAIGSGPLAMQITGPGVRQTSNCIVAGLDPSWLRARETWVRRFPLGVDVLLCDARHVVGLPRTSVITTSCDS